MWIVTEEGHYIASEHIARMSQPSINGAVEMFSASGEGLGTWNTISGQTYGELGDLTRQILADTNTRKKAAEAGLATFPKE